MSHTITKYAHLTIDELLREAQVKNDKGILVPIAQELANRLEELNSTHAEGATQEERYLLLMDQLNDAEEKITDLKATYEIAA